MYDPSKQAEHDGSQPDGGVGAGGVVDAPAQPDSQKGAKLVAEEDNRPECGEVTCSEDLRDNPAGEGDGRQPKEADGRAKDNGGEVTERDRKKHGNHYHPQSVEHAEQ